MQSTRKLPMPLKYMYVVVDLSNIKVVTNSTSVLFFFCTQHSLIMLNDYFLIHHTEQRNSNNHHSRTIQPKQTGGRFRRTGWRVGWTRRWTVIFRARANNTWTGKRGRQSWCRRLSVLTSAIGIIWTTNESSTSTRLAANLLSTDIFNVALAWCCRGGTAGAIATRTLVKRCSRATIRTARHIGCFKGSTDTIPSTNNATSLESGANTGISGIHRKPLWPTAKPHRKLWKTCRGNPYSTYISLKRPC